MNLNLNRRLRTAFIQVTVRAYLGCRPPADRRIGAPALTVRLPGPQGRVTQIPSLSPT